MRWLALPSRFQLPFAIVLQMSPLQNVLDGRRSAATDVAVLLVTFRGDW